MTKYPKGWGSPGGRSDNESATVIVGPRDVTGREALLLSIESTQRDLVRELSLILGETAGQPPSKWPEALRSRALRALSLANLLPHHGLLGPVGSEASEASEAWARPLLERELSQRVLLSKRGTRASGLRKNELSLEYVGAWVELIEALQGAHDGAPRKRASVLADWLLGMEKPAQDRVVEILGLEPVGASPESKKKFRANVRHRDNAVLAWLRRNQSRE